MSRPNILFLMTDQQRWDGMGCSGGWVRTPHLDRLAAEGLRFANCVTTSPVCIPARVTLATGRYPHNTGVWNNCRYDLPADTPTWMQAIRQAGYRTSLFGKTHLHHHSGDLREREHLLHAYGLDDVDEIGGPRASARVLSHMTAHWEELSLWDEYRADFDERFANKPHVVRPSTLPLEEYADVYVGQRAKTYLQNYDRSDPWFCWVSFGGPHEPWDTPEPYASMYDPASMPPPVEPAADDIDRPEGALHRRLGAAPELTVAEVAAMRANYAGNITLIDDQIGEILDAIAQRGELDNTLIVFTSDHGELNGDYGLIYKSVLLNGAARVPLLIRPPRASSGRTSPALVDTPVELFDIGPTLVDIAGGCLEHQQFARSLAPLLDDPSAPHRDFAISEIDGEIMYLDRKWKMVLNDRGKPYLLFDQENDIAERNNLVGTADADRVVDSLRLRILERLIQTQPQLNR